MERETKKRIQLALAVVLAFVAVRTAYVLYERRSGDEQTPSGAREAAGTTHNTLTADDYVHERAFLGHDLESTRRHLKGTTVWVKAGNYYSYYPYDAASRRVNEKRDMGVLPPLAKLEIKDVVLVPGKHNRSMMAVFSKEDDPKLYALPIGAERNGDYSIVVQDVLFRQDPRQLYKHWSPETWQAIERHEPQTGMSELQTWFAIGVGLPTGSGDPGHRTLLYQNNGKPLEVRFVNNRAVEIRQQ